MGGREDDKADVSRETSALWKNIFDEKWCLSTDEKAIIEERRKGRAQASAAMKKADMNFMSACKRCLVSG